MTALLVIGANGQVGSELNRLGVDRGYEIMALDRQELNISDATAVRDRVLRLRPAAVINAAAYTQVDKAEEQQALAFAVNRDGPAHLAEACREAAIPLLHISTDYVFDGTRAGAYREDDPAAPLGVYGQSKWEGEQRIRQVLPRHLILRVSWVFGARGNNFVRTMLRVGRERDELGVVADQRGCPTPAADIAQVLLELADRIGQEGFQQWGTYHYCGAPATTWHGFAQAIFATAQGLELLERRPRVRAITTAEYPTPARRPANSVLDTHKLQQTFGIVPRPWQEGLRAVLEEWKAL